MGLENYTIDEFIANYTPKVIGMYERPYDEGVYQTLVEDLITGVQFDLRFTDDNDLWFSDDNGYFAYEDYMRIVNNESVIDRTWDAIDRWDEN